MSLHLLLHLTGHATHARPCRPCHSSDRIMLPMPPIMPHPADRRSRPSRAWSTRDVGRHQLEVLDLDRHRRVFQLDEEVLDAILVDQHGHARAAGSCTVVAVRLDVDRRSRTCRRPPRPPPPIMHTAAASRRTCRRHTAPPPAAAPASAAGGLFARGVDALGFLERLVLGERALILGAGLPTSRLTIWRMMASSQFLAFLLTSAMTSSTVRWIQSRSCAAQIFPRSGRCSWIELRRQQQLVLRRARRRSLRRSRSRTD